MYRTRTETLGSKTMIKMDNLCSIVKKGSRKASPRVCCWICMFSVLFIIVAFPDFDLLNTRYIPTEYSANINDVNFDTCGGRRIYMYELPPKFNVAVHNLDRCNHSLVYWLDLCPRFRNKGYGLKLRDESASTPFGLDDDGFDRSNWFDTDSYMLEMIFHTRMQNYRCWTKNSSQADAFYVPYYTGLLALDYLYDKTGLRTTYEKRRLYGQEIMEWLEKNGGEAWRRYEGRDHFLIMGRTTWDFNLHHVWGTGFSALPYVMNMTHLLLEKNPRLENQHAIPYPTSFHPDSPKRLERWMEQVKRSERKYLFSYVGAPRPDSWSVRGIMSNACINAGESVCNLVNCSVVKCSHEPIPIYESFLHSNFCLQPRGDTATRRSTFDCLISGAIPVFFHVDTAYSQYSWHLPRIKSFSVYIPEAQLKKGTVSIQKVLMSYSPEQISRMRKSILAIIPSLLYNDFENDDPFSAQQDAFELSIQKVLGKIASMKRQMASTYKCWIPFRHCASSF